MKEVDQAAGKCKHCKWNVMGHEIEADQSKWTKVNVPLVGQYYL